MAYKSGQDSGGHAGQVSGASGNPGASRSGKSNGSGGNQSSGPKSGPQNAREVDDAMAAKYGLTPDQYTNATKELRNKITDAKDTGEGMLNAIGKGFLSLFGYSEVDPTESTEALNQSWGDSIADAQAGINRPVDESADRRIDPIKAALTATGPLTGGLGTALSVGYGLYGLAGGPRPEIDLGPSGPATPDNLTDSQRQLAGLAPRTGLLSGGAANSAPATRASGGSRTGLLTSTPPVEQVQNALIAAPATIPTTPATPPVDLGAGYPTPAQKIGISPAMTNVFDPSTGRIVRVPA